MINLNVIDKIINYAISQIGTKESPAGSNKVKYNPFDITRPVNAGKTWNTDVNFSVDRNPYKQLYSRRSCT